jgi:putative transposase
LWFSDVGRRSTLLSSTRYQPAARGYSGLSDIDYPLNDKTIVVTRCGCGRIYRTQKINFSTIVAGQAVGIKEVHDDIWLVSFMGYDLGYFDLETRVLEPRCGRDPC